jgi:hypothetical protein
VNRENLEKMAVLIKAMKEGAETLKALSQGLPAVDRNTDRILASIRMLEINVSDLLE